MRRRLLFGAVVGLAVLLTWLLFQAPPGEGAGGSVTAPPPVAEPTAQRPLPVGDAVSPGAALDRTAPAEDTLADALGAPLLTADSGIHSFRGRIVDPEGRPVPGARVEAFGFQGWVTSMSRRDFLRRGLVAWSTETDAAGRFVLPEAPRDGLRFVLRFLDPDLAPRQLVNLPTVPGRTRDLGDVVLESGYAIEGRVLDERGAPIGGAVVRVHPASSVGFGRSAPDPLPMAPATTGDDGRFRLDRVPAGRVRLHADAPGAEARWSGLVDGDTGDVVRDVELRLPPARMLRGRVVDEGRRAVRGARVTATARIGSGSAGPNDRFEAEVRSDAVGAFALEVPQEVETLRVEVVADGYLPSLRTLRGNDVTSETEFVLRELPPLTGVVVDAQGAPVAGARVALVERRSADLPPDQARRLAETTSGDDGGFTLSPDLTRSRDRSFVVHAWDGEHAPATSEPLAFAPADPEQPAPPLPALRLVLEPGHEVAGVVRTQDGSPLAGARVHLRKLRAPRRSRFGGDPDVGRRGGTVLRRVTSDAEGRFSFPGLVVGDYRVEAMHPEWSPTESDDLAVVDPKVEVELRMAPPSAIVGQVVGDLRALPSRLQVTARMPGAELLDAPVAEDGSFRFDRVRPGSWTIELRGGTGGLDDSLFVFGGTTPLARLDEVEVLPGVETPVELEVDLVGLGVVSGRVWLDGEPGADAMLSLLPHSQATSADPNLAGREVFRSMRRTAADHEGRYRIAGVPPGDYWLVLTRPGRWPSGLFQSGGGLDPRGLARAEVTVTADGEVRRDFDVAFGDLEVVVDGGRASVTATLEPLTAGEGELRGFRLRPRGEVLEGIVAGAYRLVLGPAEDPISVHPVTVPAGGQASVHVVLPDTAPEGDRGGRAGGSSRDRGGPRSGGRPPRSPR